MSSILLASYTDIDTTALRLSLIRRGEVVATYPISVGAKGVGNKSNSGKTPLGQHTIAEKIGHDQPLGMHFSSRKATGTIWHEDDAHRENLILTRICWLRGLEQGVNSGTGVDTYDRYIYIHGTNCEAALGKKNVSHGCILMANADIVSYFNQIEEGEHVSIHQ